MSSNAALLLTLVKTLNSVLTLTRELKISFGSLKKIMDKAEQEGRDVSLSDLQELRDESDEAHQALKDAIAEHEGSPPKEE